MGVTVKKRTLKLKTVKTVPVGGSADADAAKPQPSIATDPATIQEKGPSYTAYGIMGILAVLMFIGLLMIQWIEYSDYANSGLFPTPEAMATVAVQSSSPTTSDSEDL